MKILTTSLRDENENVTIDLLISETIDAPDSGGEFVKSRISIQNGPVPRVAVLQLIVLRRMRNVIDEQIQSLQSALRLNNVDIPQV